MSDTQTRPRCPYCGEPKPDGGHYDHDRSHEWWFRGGLMARAVDKPQLIAALRRLAAFPNIENALARAATEAADALERGER